MSRVIVCVGDSLTEGMFTSGYPQVLQGMLRQQQPNGQWVVKQCAQNAASTSVWLSGDLIQKFKQTVAGGCDAIVIMLGTNDVRVGSGFTEQGFTERLTQLTKKLMSEAPGAMVFLCTPPPVAGDKNSIALCFDAQTLHSTFPRIIPQIAASLGVTYIDIFSAFGGATPSPSLYGPDGYHLGQEGDSRVAAAVYEHVTNKLSGAPIAGNRAANTASLPMNAITASRPDQALTPPPTSMALPPAQSFHSQTSCVNEAKISEVSKMPPSVSVPTASAPQRRTLQYQAPAVGNSQMPYNTVSPTSYNTIAASFKTADVPQSNSPTSYSISAAPYKTVDIPQSQSILASPTSYNSMAPSYKTAEVQQVQSPTSSKTFASSYTAEAPQSQSPTSYNTIAASYKTADVQQVQSPTSYKAFASSYNPAEAPQSQSPTSYNTIAASYKTVDVPQSQSIAPVPQSQSIIGSQFPRSMSPGLPAVSRSTNVTSPSSPTVGSFAYPNPNIGQIANRQATCYVR